MKTEYSNSFERYYMNQMQILVNVIDSNNIFAEVARAGEKQKVLPDRALFVWPMTCRENFPSWYIKPT